MAPQRRKPWLHLVGDNEPREARFELRQERVGAEHAPRWDEPVDELELRRMRRGWPLGLPPAAA
jgi:hypothetical protein